MEQLLQYMDDVDDLIGALGLVYERLRRLLLSVVSLLIGLGLIASGMALALVHPPIALATSMLLFVMLLYRMVTAPVRDRMQLT
jgi:hypothetical protein